MYIHSLLQQSAALVTDADLYAFSLPRTSTVHEKFVFLKVTGHEWNISEKNQTYKLKYHHFSTVSIDKKTFLVNIHKVSNKVVIRIGQLSVI
jgi:hypothetical protein